MNLAENLERSAYYFPDRLAILQENKKISYQEFNQGSNSTGKILKRELKDQIVQQRKK